MGLALHLMVQNAMAGTRTGAAVVTAVLAAGGALLAIGLLAGHGGAQVLGAVALLGGLGAAGLRLRWKRALVGLAIAALLAAAPRVAVMIADWFTAAEGEPAWAHDALETFEGIWVVFWLVAGAVWLGNLSIVRAPDDAPRPSVADPASAPSPR